MRHLTITILGLTALTLTACSTTTTPHPGGHLTHTPTPAARTGAEVITAEITGHAAVTDLESAANAPLILGPAQFTGLIRTIGTAPLRLGNGTNAVFTTRTGNLAVTHTKPPKNGGTPVIARYGTGCQLTELITGTFTIRPAKSTGAFKNATGAGTWSVSVKATTPLKKGKTKCFAANMGAPEPATASILFEAKAPSMRLPG